MPSYLDLGLIAVILVSAFLAMLRGFTREVLAIAERTLQWFKSIIEKFREEIASFGNFPTLFLGIVKKDGGLTFYDGKIRVVSAAGDVVEEGALLLKFAPDSGISSQ